MLIMLRCFGLVYHLRCGLNNYFKSPIFKLFVSLVLSFQLLLVSLLFFLLDIDECQEQNVCNGDKQVCLNTRGGYKCNHFACPPNYVRDKDHRKWVTVSSKYKYCNRNYISIYCNTFMKSVYSFVACVIPNILWRLWNLTIIKFMYTGSFMKDRQNFKRC